VQPLATVLVKAVVKELGLLFRRRRVRRRCAGRRALLARVGGRRRQRCVDACTWRIAQRRQRTGVVVGGRGGLARLERAQVRREAVEAVVERGELAVSRRAQFALGILEQAAALDGARQLALAVDGTSSSSGSCEAIDSPGARIDSEPAWSTDSSSASENRSRRVAAAAAGGARRCVSSMKTLRVAVCCMEPSSAVARFLSASPRLAAACTRRSNLLAVGAAATGWPATESLVDDEVAAAAERFFLFASHADGVAAADDDDVSKRDGAARLTCARCES
jgi:hypothetical protein